MIYRETRILKRWQAISIVAIYCAGLAAVLWAMVIDGNDWRGMLAGGPFWFLMGYLIALGALNTRRVWLDSAGVRLKNGPLPGTGGDQAIPKESLRQIGHRLNFEREGKGPLLRYYTAGVETTSGQWIEVLGRFDTPAGSERAAQQIASTLALPVNSVCGPPLGVPRSAAWRVIGWGGAFIAALIWGAFVELYR